MGYIQTLMRGERSADIVAGFHFTVDYGQTFKERVSAGGYDYINGTITEAQFPYRGVVAKVSFEGALFGFDGSVIPDRAAELIKAADGKTPWDVARIEHLLAFGAAFPDEQRKYPIVALGSVINAETLIVPYIGSYSDKRSLDLHKREGVGGSLRRFLAVRMV